MSNALAGGPATQPAPVGEKQLDGNVTAIPDKPTRGPLQSREGSPMAGRSGIERAMGAAADKLHPTRRR